MVGLFCKKSYVLCFFPYFSIFRILGLISGTKLSNLICHDLARTNLWKMDWLKIYQPIYHLECFVISFKVLQLLTHYFNISIFTN